MALSIKSLTSKEIGMLKRTSTVAVWCVVIVLWALNCQADTIFQSVGIASSPNPVGSGARALGMGGAFIAVADDATAASWNPAGLVQLERPEFSFVGDYVRRKEEYSSSTQPEIDNDNTTDKTRPNFLSFTYPFNLLNRNLVFSLNYQRLYDFERSFDYNLNVAGDLLVGSQKVNLDQDGYLGAMGLAAAYEITSWLSLGVTFNYWNNILGIRNGWDSTEKTRDVITAFGPNPINPPLQNFITVRNEFDNFKGFNWNFGLLWNINKYLSLGAVLKTSFWGSVDHTRKITNRDSAGNITSTVIERQDAELRLPMSYGGGISCRFTDNFTMDLDVYRTEWDDFTYRDGSGKRFSPIEGLPKNLSDVDDTTQVRLGAEYLFLFPEKYLVVPVRAGAFYDPEPREGDPEDFYGVSIGSGIGYKQFIFDMAYQFRWGDNVDGDHLITTGDTDLDVRQHTVLASMIFHF